jgi:hypothetical protein
LKNRIQELISVEIDRFMHGLQAAKKHVSVRGIVLDPGELRGYVERDTQLRRISIQPNIIRTAQDMHAPAVCTESVIRMAEIAWMTDMPRAQGINKIANKHVRWLLPHAVEKEQ